MELESRGYDEEVEGSSLNSVAQIIFRSFPKEKWLPVDPSRSDDGCLPGTESLSNLTKLYMWRMPSNVHKTFQVGTGAQIRYIIEDECHRIVLIGVETEDIEDACCGPLWYWRTLHLYDVHGKEALRVQPVAKKPRSRFCAPVACCCFASGRHGAVFEVLAISAQLVGHVDDPQVVRIRRKGCRCRPRFEAEMLTRERHRRRMRVRAGGLLCGAVPEWRRNTIFSVQLDGLAVELDVNDENEGETCPLQFSQLHFSRIRESEIDLNSPDEQQTDFSNQHARTRRRNSDRSDDEDQSAATPIQLLCERPRVSDDPLLRECPDAAFALDVAAFSLSSRSLARLALLGVAYAIDTTLVRRADAEFD